MTLGTTKESKALTLVVATDFSETADAALEAALRFIGEGELHLVHVQNTATWALAAEAMAASASFSEGDDLARIRADLEMRCKRVAAHVPVRGHIRRGDPAREIAQLASDVGADMVIVGTHARSGIARVLFGSVAEELVRISPCPVLIIKNKAHSATEAIDPPCPECLETRAATSGATYWCPRHLEHHPRAHTFHMDRQSFAVGAQTFRGLPQ